MQKEILELQKLIKNRNIDKAYEIAKKLSRTDINNKEVIKILTFLYIQRGQFDAAIDRLEKYYNDNPNEKDFDYFINMGVSLKSVEEFQKSLEMYKEAQKINPESPLCYTVPAEINLKIRNFNESLRLINIALDKINKSDARDSIHFPNAIKLKTEINVALQKDEENMEMLKSYLREEFHPDIFYLLATVNPSIIDDELLNLAHKHLQHNDDAFQNNLDRFWFVHPL